MKKSSLLLIAVSLILAGCGTVAKMADSTSSARFEDGIYSSTPSFMSRTEKQAAQNETDALVERTKASKIYLFGEKKDTVMIPENMSARIQYDKELGSTVVTVGENPYDWQNYIDPWGYYSPYTPYSIGSSWYWSRHYNPWYWDAWSYNPWYYRYGGWYGGWYDPWYYGYGGWYDPWYYGGWYGYMHPYYCGWYGGWDPYWHHHHHHGPIYVGGGKDDRWHGSRHSTGSDRVFTSRVSTRGGIGSSSRVGRTASTTSASRQSVSGKAVASRTGGTSASRTTASKVSAPRRTSGTASAITSTQSKPVSVGSGTPVRGTIGSGGSATARGSMTAGQNFRRPSAASQSGSISTGSAPVRSPGSSYRPAAPASRSYGASSGSSYRSSSSSSSSRSSSYSSGSSTRSSFSSGSSSGRSSYSGGGGYSGGGSSRSGGSSGGRR